jgi:hypothetical protein
VSFGDCVRASQARVRRAPTSYPETHGSEDRELERATRRAVG